MKAIEIPVRKQIMRGNLYIPEHPDKNTAVLFIHGWTGHPNERAAGLLAKNGYYVLTFSLRGHNNSDGEIEDVTCKMSLEDVTVAYDFLVSQLPPGTVVVVAGSSYGGYLTAMLSGERSLKAVSLRVPAPYPDEDFDKPRINRGGENPEVAAWRKKPTSFTENTAFNRLHDFTGKVQIIEAEFDEQVPHEGVKNYVNAVADKNQLTYHFMKNWPHSLGDDPERNKEFEEILLNWLTK